MKSILTPFRISLSEQLSGRILDCGSGEDLFGAHLRREGNDVISLDIDEEALKKTPGKWVVASCSDIPFPDDYFDAVWACAIIEHVKAETLPEMIRVTRPGGRIVAVTPNGHSPFDPLKRILGMETWRENEGHIRLYTACELRFYGPVYGETRFIPLFVRFFRRHPEVAHILVLDVQVTEKLKEKVARRFARATPSPHIAPK